MDGNVVWLCGGDEHIVDRLFLLLGKSMVQKSKTGNWKIHCKKFELFEKHKWRWSWL